MSVQRTYYCDGPHNTDIPNQDHGDRCPVHASTVAMHLPGGFLRVVRHEESALHFCSWDCVLRYASNVEPVEVIPFHDEREEEPG
jgi:hypothetical protein